MKNIILSTIFAELCQNDNLVKNAFVRKMPNGYWGVFSHKGKLLGKYKTKEQAKQRLKDIEFFKNKKASSNDQNFSYSEMMRQISKKYPSEILKEFRQIFKKTFDKALLNEENYPEEKALEKAKEFIDQLNDQLDKTASAIEMGDPIYAGKYIAEIIKFLMRRISADSRPKSLASLKHKIHQLNEYDIAAKEMPASSAIGQSINLTKQLLLSHSPAYIRSVINSIVSNL